MNVDRNFNAGEAEIDTVETASPVGRFPDLGDQIAGYELNEIIESGGMGIVYLAKDHGLGREVAIKVISPSLADDEKFRQRFIAESRAVASIRNPYVLPVFRAGEDEGLLYLVTPLIAGGDLRTKLSAEGPLEPSVVATIVTQVAQALDAAHSVGLLHRDVKPANVLIDETESGSHCYLTDFGIARDTGRESGITNTGEVLGTVDYMAPETIEGSAPDEGVDVYSLGCMAIELLTGHPPYRRENKRQTMLAHLSESPELPNVPGVSDQTGLARVMGKAIAKDPGERYPSCGSFANDLSGCLSGVVGTAPTTTIPTQTGTRSRRSGKMRRVSVIALALIVLAGAGAGGYALAGNEGAGNGDAEPTIPSRAATPPTDGIDPDDGSTGANGSVEFEPEDPYPESDRDQVSLDHLYNNESEKLIDAKFDGTIEDAAEFRLWKDVYPSIGRTEYRQGLVLELSEYTASQELMIPLEAGWDQFEAEVGMLAGQAPAEGVKTTFLASDGSRTRVLKSLGTLVTGGTARKVSLDLSNPHDTQLIIRFGVPQSDENQSVVLGNARFVGSPE